MVHFLVATILLAPVSIPIRVDGEGYLRFVRDGRVVYAKQATLVVEAGKLCSKSGTPLIPTIQLPDDIASLTIDLQGNVLVGKNAVGRLVLALFPNEGMLQTKGDFLVSVERPKLGSPGDDTCGVIRMLASAAPAKPDTGIASNPAPTKSAASPAIVKGSIERASQKQDSVVITVHPQSSIEGKSFTLGEIAEIHAPPEVLETLKGVVVGDSPPLGTERGIDQVRVLARLRMAGLKPEGWAITVPSNARVLHDGQHISNLDFVHAAQNAVREQLGVTAPMNSAVPAPEMVVPHGELQLVAESVAGNGLKATVVIGVYVDSKRFNSRTVTLGGVAGGIFVRAGTTVKIRVVSSGAAVETTGKAKTPGAVGQTIEVQTDAGATFTGTVLENGMVEVRL